MLLEILGGVLTLVRSVSLPSLGIVMMRALAKQLAAVGA